MMAAVDAQQSPAVPLDNASEVASGMPSYGDFENALFAAGLGRGDVDRKQPSMASCRLRISSSMVSPWVAQPGMAGTSAQKPPSSASCTTTLIFILTLPLAEMKIRRH